MSGISSSYFSIDILYENTKKFIAVFIVYKLHPFFLFQETNK